MDRIWKPNVTVAAIVERDGRFLLVEEETDDGIRLNQPAGHLDEGESLVDAAAREALEETAHRFMPEYLVGIYQWRRPAGGFAAGPPQGGAVSISERSEQPSPPSSGRGAGGERTITYLRFAFGGRLLGVEAERALDHGILRALWLTPEEIAAERTRHRSPLVMQCIRDYLAGRRFGLDLITHYET